jgi:hypothetical protein
MARFSPFGATLTLRAVGQDTTLLVIEGSYEPLEAPRAGSLTGLSGTNYRHALWMRYCRTLRGTLRWVSRTVRQPKWKRRARNQGTRAFQ